MKKRTDKERHSDSISTLLGEDARIEGLLDFEGTLRLEQRGRDNLVLSGGRRGDKEMAPIAIPAERTYR